MYTVSARAHYDSAHYLEDYEGKCSRVHGHHYVVEAAISVMELGRHGFAFDFVDLKRELRALADELDHHLLNDLPQFEGTSTSAEVQAKYFHDRLKERLPTLQSEGLAWVRVWETPTSWAQYGPVPGWAPPLGGDDAVGGGSGPTPDGSGG
jgi:6-pyruvoyltetrahydropterin/6-carboxytetrahydropterin synthase